MDVQYFINKFEAIPEEEWTVGTQQDKSGRRCAYGHCMPVKEKSRGCMAYSGYGHETEEGVALKHLFSSFFTWIDSVPTVNNGSSSSYRQPTPKQRILAALRDIQSHEEQDKAVLDTEKLLSETKKQPILVQ
jgi:hypothetical protein